MSRHVGPTKAIAYAFEVLHGRPTVARTMGDAMGQLFMSGVLNDVSGVTPSSQKELGRWVYEMLNLRVAHKELANDIRSKL